MISGKIFAQLQAVEEGDTKSSTKEAIKMQYRLAIYASGGHGEDNCIKAFTSSAPFPPLHVGDLLDASTWGYMGFKCLRVLSVEHAIVEKAPLGIDPSGRMINQTLVHAEGVLDSARYQLPAAS